MRRKLPPGPDGERSQVTQPLQEVFFEFIPVGNSVKVVAIDAATGVEVSIVGAVAASQSELERTAYAKLKYVLERQAKSRPGPRNDDEDGWTA